MGKRLDTCSRKVKSSNTQSRNEDANAPSKPEAVQEPDGAQVPAPEKQYKNIKITREGGTDASMSKKQAANKTNTGKEDERKANTAKKAKRKATEDDRKAGAEDERKATTTKKAK